MGIQGLLRGMPMEKGNIVDFKGQNLAIDASSWLFKAGYSCAERLVESIESGKSDPICERIYCRYMANRCRELFSHGNKIYLVFDGQRCPLKANTNAEREQRRKTNLNEARRLKSIGQTAQAQEKYKACLGKGTDIMARIVSSYLKKTKQVECVFSPYEADAQLVRLVYDGHAQAVVTEDSDVLVYSATCGVSFPILYKLDRTRGTCQIIRMDWLLSSFPKKNKKQKVSDVFWSVIRSFAMEERKCKGRGVRLFVQACVLSGCDYVANTMAGVGLINAFSLVQKHSHISPHRRFQTILQSKLVPNLVQYETLLSQSEIVFYHHTVRQLPPSLQQQNSSNNKKRDVVSNFFSSQKSKPSPNKQKPNNIQQLIPLNLPTSSSPNLKRFVGSSGLDFLGNGTSEVLLSSSLDIHTNLDETDVKDDYENHVDTSQNSSSSIDEPMFNRGCGKIQSLLNNNPLSQFAFPGSALFRNKQHSSRRTNDETCRDNHDENNENDQPDPGTNAQIKHSNENKPASTMTITSSDTFTPRSDRKKTVQQGTISEETDKCNNINDVIALNTSTIVLDGDLEKIKIVTPPLEENKKNIQIPRDNLNRLERALSISDSSNEFINEDQYFNDGNHNIGKFSNSIQSYTTVDTSSSIDAKSFFKETENCILLEKTDDSNDCIIVDPPSSNHINNDISSANKKHSPSSYPMKRPVVTQKSKYFTSPIAKSFAKSNSLSRPPQMAPKRQKPYVSAFQSGQMSRIFSPGRKRLKKSPSTNNSGPMDGFLKQQQLWQQYSSRSQQQTVARKKLRQADNNHKNKPPPKSSIKSFFRPIKEI